MEVHILGNLPLKVKNPPVRSGVETDYSLSGISMLYAPYPTQKTVGTGEGAPYIVHPAQPDALMIVVPAKLN